MTKRKPTKVKKVGGRRIISLATWLHILETQASSQCKVSYNFIG